MQAVAAKLIGEIPARNADDAQVENVEPSVGNGSSR
jgi:hypothetical protein